MNFMVRYRPDEQPFLRPHHDRSCKWSSFRDFHYSLPAPLTPSMWPSTVSEWTMRWDFIERLHSKNQLPRAVVVGSSDTTAKSQGQRLDGCSCIRDVSPTTTRASMWRKAQDTSWSLSLTLENILTSRAFLGSIGLNEYSRKNTREDWSHRLRKFT